MRPGTAGLLVALVVFVFCPHVHPGVAAPTKELADRLLAGAAAVDITPPVGVPLAGYGGFGRRLLIPDLLGRYPYAFWFKPSQGTHLPIMARALVFERGEERVLLLSVDLVGIDSRLVTELRSRLASEGLRYSAVILAATHTHSGPGTFARSTLFEFLVLDRYIPEIADRLLRGMTQATRQAEQRKVPARVGGGSGTATGITTSRLDLPLDPEVGVLKVVAHDGAPVALLWNYAVHGTALGQDNRRFSGDLMGIAAQRLEQTLGVPALYTNGAVGDVSPARHGLAGAEVLGEALAAEVLAVWSRVAPEADTVLSVAVEPLALPRPRLSLRGCLGRWVPASATLGLGWALPRQSMLVGVAVGAHAWVTIPGELQTQLGQEVKAEGRRLFRNAFLVGLANDYLGYFLTRDAFRRAGYIECASFYGETGGETVAERAKALLRRLRHSRRAPS